MKRILIIDEDRSDFDDDARTEGRTIDGRMMVIRPDGRVIKAHLAESLDGLRQVHFAGRQATAGFVDPLLGARAAGSNGDVRAPMPGRIVRVNVEVGQRVEAKQSVVVMEAMKMENELKAPASGRVAKVHITVGQSVEGKAVLVEIAPE